MRNQIVRSALILSIIIWGVAVIFILAFWLSQALNGDAPVDYLGAISSNRGAVEMGWLTQAQADQRITEARDEFLTWAWDQTKIPLVGSTIFIPRFTWFLARNQRIIQKI